jgi:formate--tetrahydrofolate ligase
MTNLEVAQAAKMCVIAKVADQAGLQEDDYEALGRYKGKLTFEGVNKLVEKKGRGKLVLVTAITPTPAGEGKTTVTVGLTQGLNKIGVRAVSATREPALGPIFGNKGGACGGGYSQVVPMEDINLFFTGDFPAITAAHNLLSALLDAHLHHGNALEIDPRVLRWPRAVDMNDRALREIVTGLGGKTNGPTREGGFVITPASEVMAILCLSRNLKDLKERLGNIVIGVGFDRKPRFCRDLKAAGAMTALLRDAMRPNLAQNIENGLALIHGGPFGNIAHGCSSIISTECGLGLADYVVTEAGFASDLGAEKFLNIVCPRLGRGPDAIVLVTTVKAIELHGKGELVVGMDNLKRHLKHLRNYGPPLVVTVNQFSGDSVEQLNSILKLSAEMGVTATISDPFSAGGDGCREVATAVVNACETSSSFKPLYESGDSIEEKLHQICTKAYGGTGVRITAAARKDLDWIERNGFGELSVCVAKTQYSLSDDATLVNAPEDFTITVREFRLSAGAGFVIAICGDILLMPGLTKTPSANLIDVDVNGKIVGLF